MDQLPPARPSVPAAMPAATPGTARTQALLYDGRVGELYGIFLLNILFTILTLGIFRFWAVTRYRRYLWSRMRFQGERFEYTGTGGELFVGWLLAGLALLGLILAAGALAYVLSLVSQELAVVPILLLYVFVGVLGAGAIFSAQRYRLTRTVWRGIRGGMAGSMLAYGARAVLYLVLSAVTLLQMVPWTQVRLAEARINASSFGNARFLFQGRAGQLYLSWLGTCVAVVLLSWAFLSGVGLLAWSALPRLQAAYAAGGEQALVQAILLLLRSYGAAILAGLVIFAVLAALARSWYVAKFERHVAGNTALNGPGTGGVRFASTMTGRGLLGLMAGNLLILVVTLGLGYPVVIHRNARFLARTLWVDGTINAPALAQSTQAAPRFGEGMFQQLDAAGGVI